jgi:uncharacterized membrane protein
MIPSPVVFLAAGLVCILPMLSRCDAFTPNWEVWQLAPPQQRRRHQPCPARCPSLVLAESMLAGPPLDVESTMETETVTVVDSSSPTTSNRVPRRSLSVSSELTLPFSAETAYDAFSDLPRQPEWSPWLHSVEFMDSGSTSGSSNSTKWTLKFMGLTYSWISIATQQDRPHLIEWESVSGLKNFGTVQFQPLSSRECHMTMTMTFVPPRLVSAVFGNSKKNGGVKRFMEHKMIGSSLCRFRDVIMIMETDRLLDSALVESGNATMIFFPI